MQKTLPEVACVDVLVLEFVLVVELVLVLEVVLVLVVVPVFVRVRGDAYEPLVIFGVAPVCRKNTDKQQREKN